MILIYKKSLDEPMDHLRAIFNPLRDASLFANLEKCIFCTNRVSFLGYVVTAQRIEVDDTKIEAIETWSLPQNVRYVMSLLGLVYFNAIAALFHELAKKNVMFHWRKA